MFILYKFSSKCTSNELHIKIKIKNQILKIWNIIFNCEKFCIFLIFSKGIFEICTVAEARDLFEFDCQKTKVTEYTRCLYNIEWPWSIYILKCKYLLYCSSRNKTPGVFKSEKTGLGPGKKTDIYFLCPQIIYPLYRTRTRSVSTILY